MRIVSVEGNVGSGKSSLLAALSARLEDGDFKGLDVKVLQEPVHEWCSPVLPDGRSMLEAFYSDPSKYAFPFQMHVLFSRYRQAASLAEDAIVVTERCIESDMELFAKAGLERGLIDDVEWVAYTSWHEWASRTICGNVEYVYLRTSPKVCMDRVRARNRHGEEDVTLDYLESLNDRHDAWLLRGEEKRACIVLDGDEDNGLDANLDRLLAFLMCGPR
jgi:deoxyadenosine/deoxycytidine kinase